jgi:hypothetical protein
MDRQKIIDNKPHGAPELDDFAEGDEDADSDDEVAVQSSGEQRTQLQRVVIRRDEQREQAIAHGRTYESTANVLTEQTSEIAPLSRDLRLGLLGLHRLRRHLSYFGQGSIPGERDSLLRAWIVAGASEAWTLEKHAEETSTLQETGRSARLDGQDCSKTLSAHTVSCH